MPAKPQIAQDSFLDALFSDIVTGTEKLSYWIKHIQTNGGVDVLFELETWLRGLNAFFDIQHLPLSEDEQKNLLRRSFAPEIRIAVRILQICQRCTAELMRLGQATQVELEAFLEAQMSRNSVLDYHVSKILEQPTPLDSLSRLLECITDTIVMVDTAKNADQKNLQLFLSIGRSFQRGIRDCRYIDMLLCQRIRIEYDRIDNPVLSGVLKGIRVQEIRRSMALALLYLFRCLKYLEFPSRDLTGDLPLRHHLAIFSLLHSECGYLVDFLKSHFIKESRSGNPLHNAADLIVHSLKVELQRAVGHELISVSNQTDASIIYAKMENSHGIMRNCLQNCVVTLIQAVNPDLPWKAIFPSMVEGSHKSQRLRQHLWDLRQELTDVLNRKKEFDITKLMERLGEFREVSLRDLMYRDWGEFERFSDALITSKDQVESRTVLHKFVSFLDVLVAEVSKRSALQ